MVLWSQQDGAVAMFVEHLVFVCVCVCAPSFWQLQYWAHDFSTISVSLKVVRGLLLPENTAHRSLATTHAAHTHV